ncbi:MAG: DUF433 domain-containing protein [Dongiaceae bacterium]
MSESPTRFTPAEAAFLLDEPVKAIRKALDRGPIDRRQVGGESGSARSVSWADVVYLFIERDLQDELTPRARADLYRALRRMPVENVDAVRFGRYTVDIRDLKARAYRRLRAFCALEDKVELSDNGEVLLRGRGVEVHRIAALLKGGMTPQEICADNPSLTPDDVATAKAYATAHPKAGRPYPPITAKRALAGAGLEALTEVLGEVPARHERDRRARQHERSRERRQLAQGRQ